VEDLPLLLQSLTDRVTNVANWRTMRFRRKHIKRGNESYWLRISLVTVGMVDKSLLNTDNQACK